MASTYISRAASGSVTSQTTFTFSFWVKKCKTNTTQTIFMHENASSHTQKFELRFHNSDKFHIETYNGAQEYNVISGAVFRDINAWYHFVVRVDTTQATESDRYRVYVNGQQISLTEAGNGYPAQNTTFNLGSKIIVYGRYQAATPSDYFDGCLTHAHYCDGYSYGPDSFGSTDSTTGEWKINTSPNVQYGSNGHFILKDGNSVTDQSGNSNNFTVSAGTLSQTKDNPSNLFATMNNLQKPFASNDYTFQNANTRVYGNNNNWLRSYGTIGANSGKWWYELYIGTQDASGRIGWDSIDLINDGTDNYYSGLTIQSTTGTVRGGINGTAAYAPNAVQLPADGGGNATFSQGDYLGMGIDLDNNTITVHKNGNALATNWSSNSYNSSCKTSTYGTFVSASVNWYSNSGNQNIYDFNFGNGKFGSSAALTGTTYTDSNGQGVFKYQPPTNYLAFCTKNLNV